MPSKNRHSGRSAAVTGAGGGLGRDIALGLAAKGYLVFGTAMSDAEVQDLKDASAGRVSLTVCDMTKEESVKAWAAGVTDALGDSGLDILINNAGILTPGPIEVLPLDAIRREFDVNVFGALSVMNAFLPALRKARGRIVQVSTWTASIPLPFNGPSGASKAAMEVFAAVYRAELKSFGDRCRCRGRGQYENRRPGKNSSGAQAGCRGHDARTTRALWANLRIVHGRSQLHAEQRARLGRRRPKSDRTRRANPRAKPGAGGDRRRRDAPGRTREIRRRAGCSTPPPRRPELSPLDSQPTYQRSQP